MKQPTKKQLRDEIKLLRSIGSQLSNCCYNIAQKRELTERDREVVSQVVKEWDAIKRADQDRK